MSRKQLIRKGAILCAALACVALAQPTYLEHVASDPDTTRGQARLLHVLEEDLPVQVHVQRPDRVDADLAVERVERAFSAWERAAPDVVSFEFVDEPGEDTLTVGWETFDDGRVGTYRYRFEVEESGRWRFRTVEVLLDPRHELDALFRYALLQAGHALGLLGRSPFPGDAMSTVPSGQITERDVATLRALYEIPSGTPVDP